MVWYESNAVVYRFVTDMNREKKRMMETNIECALSKKVFRCVSASEQSSVCVATVVCRILGQFWDRK